MGLRTLNVWVHDQADPCKISDETWFVTITYCSGASVEWCGTTYAFMEAKCGHLEVELPPGCYVAFASRFVFVPGNPFPFNRILISSHFALAMVGCDQIACVHLYNPTYRQIVRPPGEAAWALVEKQDIPQGSRRALGQRCQGGARAPAEDGPGCGARALA
jgi:hypothetical protein